MLFFYRAKDFITHPRHPMSAVSAAHEDLVDIEWTDTMNSAVAEIIDATVKCMGVINTSLIDTVLQRYIYTNNAIVKFFKKYSTHAQLQARFFDVFFMSIKVAMSAQSTFFQSMFEFESDIQRDTVSAQMFANVLQTTYQTLSASVYTHQSVVPIILYDAYIKSIAVATIQERWRRVISSPLYSMCRKRIEYEFNELSRA